MSSKKFEVVVGNKIISEHTTRNAAIKAAKKVNGRVFHWTSDIIRAEVKYKR